MKRRTMPHQKHNAAPLVCLLSLVVAAGCQKKAQPSTGSSNSASSVAAASSAAIEKPVVRVTAAADLTAAFGELKPLFEKASGMDVSITFGSTGQAAKQLREGAPFDVFAAANTSFVDEVVKSGACDGSTIQPYAQGRVAVWTKRDSAGAPKTIKDLAAARFKHIAIANPEHAPYGVAAREAMKSSGIWTTVETRIVMAENVRQALQFAQSGNAEVAIVALSLVINDRVNPWFLVDATAHAPINQALIVCTHGKNRAGGEAFARYIGGSEARAIMKRYGFLLPGETPAVAVAAASTANP